MVSATLTKVREIKHAADARPVVLLGWGVGAAIAAHVAGLERLAGLVSSSSVFLNIVFVDADVLCCMVCSCFHLKGVPRVPRINTGWTAWSSWRPSA